MTQPDCRECGVASAEGREPDCSRCKGTHYLAAFLEARNERRAELRAERRATVGPRRRA